VTPSRSVTIMSCTIMRHVHSNLRGGVGETLPRGIITAYVEGAFPPCKHRGTSFTKKVSSFVYVSINTV
jgi:hypothetical protein